MTAHTENARVNMPPNKSSERVIDQQSWILQSGQLRQAHAARGVSGFRFSCNCGYVCQGGAVKKQRLEHTACNKLPQARAAYA